METFFRGVVGGCLVVLLIAPIWNGNMAATLERLTDTSFNRTNLEWKHSDCHVVVNNQTGPFNRTNLEWKLRVCE